MSAARKLAVICLLAWTFLIATLRGLNTPNDFAMSHWLLDYQFGFVKRGLLGSIVSLIAGLFDAPISQMLILNISCTFFVIFAVVLLAISWRITQRSVGTSLPLLGALVFLSSTFVVKSASLVGYFDNIVVLLAVVSIVLTLRERIWWAAATQSFALLIHENSMLIGFPLFCLAWALKNLQRNKRGEQSLEFLPLLVPALSFVVMMAAQELWRAQNYQELLTAHLSGFGFIENDGNLLVPKWISSSLQENFSRQGVYFPERLFNPFLLKMILLPAFALLACTLHGLRLSMLASSLLICTCLAPQLMHLVAWDMSRIWTYTLICSFLAFWIRQELFPAQPASRQLEWLCVAAILGNILILTPLVDGHGERFNLMQRLVLNAPPLFAAIAMAFLPRRRIVPAT